MSSRISCRLDRELFRPPLYMIYFQHPSEIYCSVYLPVWTNVGAFWVHIDSSSDSSILSDNDIDAVVTEAVINDAKGFCGKQWITIQDIRNCFL